MCARAGNPQSWGASVVVFGHRLLLSTGEKQKQQLDPSAGLPQTQAG